MHHRFVEVWSQQLWKKPPYILEDDLKASPLKKKFFASHEEFVDHQSFRRPEHRGDFHLGLLPVPFTGNLAAADIFICLTNPGLSILDYIVEQSEYRDLILRNLKQDLSAEQYPFPPFDPKWLWTGGGQWWNNLFQKINEGLRKANLASSYRNAAKILSKRVAAIELIPYHSIGSEQVSRLAKTLPSAKLAREYLHEILLPKAKHNAALVVIISSQTLWGVEAGLPYVSYPPKKKGPKAHLSMKPGESGRRILDWLLNNRIVGQDI